MSLKEFKLTMSLKEFESLLSEKTNTWDDAESVEVDLGYYCHLKYITKYFFHNPI